MMLAEPEEPVETYLGEDGHIWEITRAERHNGVFAQWVCRVCGLKIGTYGSIPKFELSCSEGVAAKIHGS